jgi:hypothetical protein
MYLIIYSEKNSLFAVPERDIVLIENCVTYCRVYTKKSTIITYQTFSQVMLQLEGEK